MHIFNMTLASLKDRHIAFACSGLGAGGAERVIALLAEHYIAVGARVSVIAFDHRDDPIFHPLPDQAALIRVGEGGWAPRGVQYLKRIAQLGRTLRRERPDIVISFLTKINLITLIATIGTPTPVIACERNNPQRQHSHPLWNAGLRLFYRRAAAIICQTRASLRCFAPHLRARAVVIPNPIAALSIPTPAPPCFRLVAVGRLTGQKGFDLLVDAFARIAGRHPQWRLDIWGEGQDRAPLQQRISALKLDTRVTLRGLTTTHGDWLRMAEAFVLSSRYEGFPNALGEAMAAGLPVLSTRCDFGPEAMIDDGESGMLVPSENVDALSDGLDRLLGDAALRSRLGKKARLAALTFAPATIMKQWDEILMRVLARSAAS